MYPSQLKMIKQEMPDAPSSQANEAGPMVILCDGEGLSCKVPEYIVFMSPVLRDLLKARKPLRRPGGLQKIDVEHDIENLALMIDRLSAYSDAKEGKTIRYPAAIEIQGLVTMSRYYGVFAFVKRGLISLTIDYLNDDVDHTILKCLVVGIRLQSASIVQYVLCALDDDSHPLDWRPSTVRALGVYAYQLLLRGYQRESGRCYGSRGIWEAMAERMEINELFKDQDGDESMDESDDRDEAEV